MIRRVVARLATDEVLPRILGSPRSPTGCCDVRCHSVARGGSSGTGAEGAGDIQSGGFGHQRLDVRPATTLPTGPGFPWAAHLAQLPAEGLLSGRCTQAGRPVASRHRLLRRGTGGGMAGLTAPSTGPSGRSRLDAQARAFWRRRRCESRLVARDSRLPGRLRLRGPHRILHVSLFSTRPHAPRGAGGLPH